MRRLLPPRPFLDAIAMRVAVLWLFLRGFAGLQLMSEGVGFAGSVAGSPAGLIGAASVPGPSNRTWFCASVFAT